MSVILEYLTYDSGRVDSKS